MAFYTDEPIQGASLSLLDAPTSLGESMAASFEQSWATSISPLLHSAGELNEQTMGEFRYDPTRRDIVQTRGPATPMLSKEVADQRVKESGLEVDVPADGMREGALSLLLERRRAERERALILENAPDGSMPANILAAFAAQAVDPLNIASAFIPIVGEARITAALARSTTVGARLGVRAGVGAVEGAVGAAIIEPAVYTLSQKMQDEYDLTDSLTNIAFGAVLGGSLRGVGGMIADRFAPKLEAPDALDGIPESAIADLKKAGMIDDDGAFVKRESDIDYQAEALRSMSPELRAELEPIASRQIPDAASIPEQISKIESRIAELPGTIEARVKEMEAQGMSKADARAAAEDAVSAERESLIARREMASESIKTGDAARAAKDDLAALDRGEVPARFADRVTAAAEKMKPEQAQSVKFADKAELFKQTFSSAMNGYDISPRTFLDLKSPDPVVRHRAIEQIKNAPKRTPKEYATSSQRAADDIASTPKDQSAFDREQLEFDEQTAEEVADQTGYNLADDPELKEAQSFEGQAEAFGAVYRANALCMLR